MIKTTVENEIALATTKGVKFVNVSSYNMFYIQEMPETYFKGKWIKGLQEVSENLLAVCVFQEAKIFMVDRSQQEIVSTIDNPSKSDNIMWLELIPGFNMETMPYMILRDNVSLCTIDVKNMRTNIIFESLYELNWGLNVFHEVVRDK